jgi:hypothetical protein
MRMFKEDQLSNFNFWSGAADTVKYLTADEINQVGDILEDIFPDGMSETQVNDFFWFETETIAEWLGYSDFEEIMNR